MRTIKKILKVKLFSFLFKILLTAFFKEKFSLLVLTLNVYKIFALKNRI
jgi:hypothetical protein